MTRNMEMMMLEFEIEKLQQREESHYDDNGVCIEEKQIAEAREMLENFKRQIIEEGEVK
jgi:hypothetical protein